MYKAVVFDLDGTLLDTIYDIADSMDYALNKYGLPGNTISDYKNYIGDGIYELTKRSIHNETKEKELFSLILNDYDLCYKEHNCNKTKPFSQMKDVLFSLKEKGYLLGVISNKPDFDTKKIVNYYFPNCFDYISGAKPNILSKPDRAQMDLFSSLYGLNNKDILYIGDLANDINFSTAFGCDCILCRYGYGKKEVLDKFNPIAFIEQPNDLLKILNK